MIGTSYRIIKELGRGGEGNVYLVQHIVTEQFRAAKVLRNPSGSRRFQEINAMKRLEHPSLPQVFDVIEEREKIWLILEYVRGRCLYEISKEEISPEQFFLIAEQLAAVLVYLHTRPTPVFHLDIKPSNLLLRPDGRLVLIDFGIAVRKDALQKQEECFGTPGFAAPEQFQKGAIDGRSDIYGAGAVLYYYLFRVIPDKRELVSKKMEKLKVTQIREGNWWWKREAAKLFSSCLNKDPSGRFQDAVVFRDSIRRFRHRYEIRKRVNGIAAALTFFGMVILFAVHQWKQGPSEHELQEQQRQKEQRQQRYQMLMEQADQLGFEQAVSCYEEAAGVFPADTDWIFHLLERIEVDYRFSLEEEAALKKLLFMVESDGKNTILETVKRSSREYGKLAYELGLIYWYYYEGTGGKAAAADWFNQAASIESQEYGEGYVGNNWLVMAKIHARIGSYYEKLGKCDENGILQADMLTYWEDLNQLWKMKEREAESTAVQIQLAEELLSCLILHTHELEASGKGQQELNLIVAEVEEFAKENVDFDLEGRCKAAKEAIGRVYNGGSILENRR